MDVTCQGCEALSVHRPRSPSADRPRRGTCPEVDAGIAPTAMLVRLSAYASLVFGVWSALAVWRATRRPLTPTRPLPRRRLLRRRRRAAVGRQVTPRIPPRQRFGRSVPRPAVMPLGTRKPRSSRASVRWAVLGSNQ